MNTLLWLLIVPLLFLPLIVGYGRGLDHWRMTQIWLWLLLPVIGWFVALSIALCREPKPAISAVAAPPRR